MTIILSVTATLLAVTLIALKIASGKMFAEKRKWKKLAALKPENHAEYLESIPVADGEEKKSLPNIIVILMDDMGWGDLSSFGSRGIKTPHIDGLVRGGAALTNGYASSPVCSPSRFGLLTGRYPSRGMINGVFFPHARAGKEDVFDMGYDDDGVLGSHPEKKGKAMPPALYKIVRKSLITQGILPDEITIPEALQKRGYNTAMFGKWHLGDESPHLPNDKGFDHFYGAHYSNDMIPYHFYRNRTREADGVMDQSKITADLTGEITSFIDENCETPFFAYYASPWPHHPLNAGEAFKGTSEAGLYGDCIQEVDWSVGEIIKKLEEKGIRDNTMIVFTSDNGPWHQGSPGPHRGRKGNAFDGGQIVPMIFNWPAQIPGGQKIDEQMMNIDFLPTFLEMAGVTLPKDREIDGRSLLSLLTGESDQSPQDELFYVYNMKGLGLRTRDHLKYFASYKSENSTYGMGMKVHPFLFDLKKDTGESYDLRSSHPEKAKEMRDKLFQFNREMESNPRGWK